MVEFFISTKWRNEIFGDKNDKYKEMADNLFINGIMNEKEYINVINKKRKK